MRGALWRAGSRLGLLLFRAPIYPILLDGRHPFKLLGHPETPWPRDAERGSALLAGRVPCGERTVRCAPGNLWGNPELAATADYLQSFAWLDDVAAAEPPEGAADGSRDFIETALESWLNLYGDFHPEAWRAEFCGARLMAWIAHAPRVLASSNMVLRSAAFNSMARQARHLGHALGTAPRGGARIEAAAGLAMAALLLPGLERRLKRALGALEAALDTSLFADGGPTSRNPADAERVVRCLVLLKRAHAAVPLDPPLWLQTALDRLLPFLKALDHGDHLRAQFNGAYAGEGLMDTALEELTDARGKAPARLPQSGYERLKRWRSCVIVDAGPPPLGRQGRAHHAAPLAFEFSDGPDRIVVNVGGTKAATMTDPMPASGFAAVARTTAAHSTLVFDDKNAAQLLPSGFLGDGVGTVVVGRDDNEEGIWLDCRHDGYLRRYGVEHQRKFYLNAQGTDFRGEDRLILHTREGLRARLSRRPDPLGRPVQVRFHLHPQISASPTRDGRSIILRLPHGHGWLFKAGGGSVSIEESLYVPRPGEPQKSSQILISGKIEAAETEFRWSFRRLDSKA